MKFAIFSDNTIGQINGAAEVTRHIVKLLEENHHELIIITPTEKFNHAKTSLKALEVLSIPFWKYPECRITSPFSIKVLIKIARFNPDFIITTTPFGIGLLGIMLKELSGKPLINFILTDFIALNKYYGFNSLNPILNKAQSKICNSALLNFVPSDYLKQKLYKQMIYNVANFELGLSNNYFFNHHTPNTKFGCWNNSYKNLLYVGRLAKDKNLDLLIDYVLRANNTRLNIVGDGPLRKILQQLPSEKIRILGYKRDMELAQIYNSADLFIMPSTEEVGGMALLEAVVSQTPVLAFNGKGSGELIKKYGCYGFNTTQSFYKKISYLISQKVVPNNKLHSPVNKIHSNWDNLYNILISECYTYLENRPFANNVYKALGDK